MGYRARKISAAYGSLGREKWLIADRFLMTAKRFALNCDISYEEAARLRDAIDSLDDNTSH